jgi:ABC-type Fe3+-citrate transport system substrate-binding protein
MNAINNITRLFVFTMLAAIVFVAAVSPADAANGKKNQAKLWQQADENTVQQRGRRQVVPEKYLVFRVNQFEEFACGITTRKHKRVA